MPDAALNPLDTETDALDAAILRFVAGGMWQPRDDDHFNELALRLFAYQFERNPVYRRFSEGRGMRPATARVWQDIPAVPAVAFKELPLTCFPAHTAVAVFLSSGTTSAKRSRHYLDEFALYDASLLDAFKACVLPDTDRMRIFVLMPPFRTMPDSSLAYMLSKVSDKLGEFGSASYVDEHGLLPDALVRDLRDAERQGRPVALLGTAFSFVHFLDYCAERNVRFALPPGSRVMDTGGFKGKSREVSQAELLDLYRITFGIPAGYVINEYGMSEMGSQFYDDVLVQLPIPRPPFPSQGSGRELGPPPSRSVSGRLKIGPPWARSLVVDPETLQPVGEGHEGILRHIDIINRGSVMAIQTEDLAITHGHGFELLGRAPGAEARGCSIAMDEMLSQNA